MIDNSLNDSLASPTTLVNTLTERASAVGSEDNERQEEPEFKGGLLDGQDEEEQMQEETTGETCVTLLEERNEEEQMQEENTGETCDTLLEEETVEDHPDTEVAGSTAAVDEALSIEIAAHQQTREELAQLQGQITTKDTQIQTANDNYLRLYNQSVDSYQELKEERDDLEEERDGLLE